MADDTLSLSAEGDLQEMATDHAAARGRVHGWFWLWQQVLRSVPRFIIQSTVWSVIMLKSYLRTAFRNLKQYRGYSFINIFGLAVGLAASLLIFLYVHHELSYDRFHENAKKIHRLLLIDQNLGVTNNKAGVVWPILAPTLEAELPEVLESARVFKRGRFPLDIGNQRFYSEEFAQADPHRSPNRFFAKRSSHALHFQYLGYLSGKNRNLLEQKQFAPILFL